jgi:hypothetical protein
MTKLISALSPPYLRPISHNYFSQRLRLHYVEWGNLDAPPTLLIRGEESWASDPIADGRTGYFNCPVEVASF